MNRDWWGGIFFGGIIGIMLETTLMQFDLGALTPLVFVTIMFILHLVDDVKGGVENGRRKSKRCVRRSRRFRN